MNLSSERNLLGAALILLAASVPVAIVGCDEPTGSQDAANASLAASGQSDLSGSWVLNLEESDNPRERFGSREGRREGGRRRGMRRRRGDSQGAEGAEGVEGAGPRRGGGRRLRAGRQFEITQDDGSVTFSYGSYGSGASRTLETDGQITTRELRGREVQIRAFWSDGALVVERTGSEGGTFTQTYSLSDDGAQLFLTIRVEHDRLDEPIESQLVYDRS